MQYSASGGGGFRKEDKQSLVTDTVKITQMAHEDFVDIPVYIPEGKTLYVWLWGVRTDMQTTPEGLTAQLYDHGLNRALSSANTRYQTGNPLVWTDGPVDASLRIYNGTGEQLNAGGYFGATIE